ncbi:MAG: response regulator [Pirellulaceae bacterium]
MSTFFELEPIPNLAPVIVPPRKKAVVIDDDDAQLEVLTYRLEQLGYSVEAFQSGRNAFENVKRISPDVVLLDVEMPGASGLDICNQLSDSPETAEIPVIILSGTSRKDIVREARAVGSRFFVHKPYDPNTLKLIVESVAKDSE